MNRLAVFSLSMGAALLPVPGLVDELAVKLITEHSPFTQASAEDRSGGEATEFVLRVLDGAGISHELQYLPWRRAYDYVSREPDTLIFPLARNTQREARFHWVGQLIPVNYYLFRLKERREIAVNSLDDARQYRIGVVNYHVHHEYLLALGFTDLQIVNGNVQNIKKALLKRIDLFPISDGGLVPICERENIDCALFEPVLKLEDISGGLYMAYSLSTAENIVDASRRSYKLLLDDGTHKKIFQARLDTIKQFNANWPIEAIQRANP